MGKNFCKLFALYLISMVFFAEAVSIKKIEIKGNERILDDTILANISLLPNQEYDISKQEKSLKKLYNTGLFEDIKIYFDDNSKILTINILEKPMIYKVFFEGNKQIETKKLSQEVKVSSKETLDRNLIQQAVFKILNLYQQQGYYNAKIDPKIIKLSQNRVNIVFEIAEGRKALIKKVIFVGNNIFSSSKLKEVIASKTQSFFNFFSSKDVFHPDKLELDKYLLTKFYNDNGYIDFNIISSFAELNDKRDAFHLTFNVSEGEQYKLNSIKIINKIAKVDENKIKKLIDTRINKIIDVSQIDDSIAKITEYLSEQGFTFSEVDYRINKKEENLTVELEIIIGEAKRTYVDKVKISGNTKTHNDVILREMRLHERDVYSSTKLRRSQQRLEGLEFFKKVTVEPVPVQNKDNAVDLNVKVEEKSTNEVSLSLGTQTAKGVIGQIGFQEKNLFGTGKELGFSVKRGGHSTGIELNYTDPYFQNLDLLMAVNFFLDQDNAERFQPYDSRLHGGNLLFGYNLNEYLRHNLSYNLKDQSISNISSNASRYIKEEKKHKVISSIGQVVTYDRTDSFINPTKGHKLFLEQELAGVGGNTKYLSHEIGARYYYPIQGDKIVLRVKADAKYIKGLGGELIGLNERFYLGEENLRGFAGLGAGPRDKKNDALGGNLYYGGSVELKLPNPFKNDMAINSVLYMDVGNLTRVDLKNGDKKDILGYDKVRVSVGGGLEWNSPVGAIGLYYGKPLSRHKADTVKKVNFRIIQFK